MTDQFEFWDEDGTYYNDHAEHLDRVTSRIEQAIIDFCAEHTEFYADELRQWVIAATGLAAPASPDRILRHLRQRGLVHYVVLNRRASYYRVISVRGKEVA